MLCENTWWMAIFGFPGGIGNKDTISNAKEVFEVLRAAV